jgi:hypothetical protein
VQWLVDGYNVIRRDPDLRSHEAAGLAAGRAALLALLARLARETGETFVAVFDGARPGGGAPSGGQVLTIFSRPPETADDVLRRLAASLREQAVVVSSDRAVHTGARRAGAVAVDVETFLAAATAGTARADTPGGDDEDEEEERPRRGPARRPGRDVRAAARALARLRRR